MFRNMSVHTLFRPSPGGLRSLARPALITTEEWISVLEVADRYNFDAVRELAIRKLLEVTTPIEKLVVGHRYAERRLLIPGYAALCTRHNAVTIEEAVRIGLEDVVLISQTRESIRDADYRFTGEFKAESFFKSRLPPVSEAEPE